MDHVKCVGSRCNCRTCPECGRRLGRKTREILESPDRLALFPFPVMLTLTIDPKKFASPEAAHETVTDGGYIRRLLRLLGITTWVWVLEFHKSGWPHWHILVDLSERGRLTPADLRRCWHLWRDKWGLGGLDVQERDGFASPTHAVRYVTKYLTKYPRHGYPAWFLKGSRRRVCQASRKVGRLTAGESKPDDRDDKPTTTRADSRPIVDRMAECGQAVSVIRERADQATGEVVREYLGEIPVSRAELVELERAGRLPFWLSLRLEEEAERGYTAFHVYLADGERRVRERIETATAWLAAEGLLAKREEVIRERREKFLNLACVES